MINKKVIIDYTCIVIGIILTAFAINVFFSANNLVTGGFTGLSIIIQEVSGEFGHPIPLWLTNLILNVPLFLVALKVFGFKALRRTIFATLFLSVALYFTKDIITLSMGENFILVPIFGGVLEGLGLGLVFRSMATTGGTDTVASIMHTRMKHIPLSKIMFVIDSFIILIGLVVFGPIKAMYAVIAVYIITKVINNVLEGLSFAKAAFIISDEYESISKTLMDELGRGVTALSGKGMYTGSSKNILLCVVSSKEIIKVKELVYESDKNAFIMVTDIREALGKGFNDFK